ncbi:hypothetical protein [Rhodopila sp.]|uniref:hypothetical protein n=1 Tax=Rhodopila sp. TaxID=2480087 RepID=UPI003D1402BE
MNWPHGAQWEWALGEFVVLGFLFWELYSLRRTKRRDREKAQSADPAAASPHPRRGNDP